ncbi:hypothetical protein JOB18_031186 [Solea senegalensis]|uniref:Transmembrane protein 44 n=1 Tax=Solea senegalensis TaxID=28829 RepID=A0AAV6S903_SOLSE|nr:transmembrane protein 44 isoform X1 [Solea senegalensis]XP_043899357.1 transmembrane protein 44 isoform X1 [Solea senegalensis]KAG7514345.1 hypothetical protein JOB18_031186 [Solea senegalensis]
MSAMEAQPGRGFDSLFTDLLAFCVDSVATCVSSDAADKRCVLLGLSSLSSLFLLLSGLVLLYQRCRCGGNAEETVIYFYCFIGNVCNTLGAILSGQLYIQVLMGAFAAAVDAVNVMAGCFPVFLHSNSKTERRLRSMRRQRRRQHFLAVCVLMMVTGGFLKSMVNPTNRFLSGRRLLHVALPGNTDVLGYVLGWIAFVIVCTARFPAVCSVYRGQMLPQACLISGLLCSVAGSLNAAALLLYNTQVGFLLKVMPWLLSAICCVTLDLLTVVLHCCKRDTRQQLVSLSFSDTERLLGDSGVPSEENALMMNYRTQKGNSLAGTNKTKVQKMSEMGCYMDVSLQPEREICLQEEAEDRPLNRTVRGIRTEGFCFSDTSCDSSTISSDLEWDFEEANGQWRTSVQQQNDEFPFQQCPANPNPLNFCTCAMSRLPITILPGKQEGVTTVSLAK